MGSYDGAETCELVGMYLLHEVQKTSKINLGLYKDDGLGVIRGTARTIENMKKASVEHLRSTDLRSQQQQKISC
jgi:hypothetical protein